MRRRAPLLCALVLGVTILPRLQVDASTNIQVPELMALLAEVSEAGGRFTETKYLSILKEPLVLEGEVIYRAPDYIRKQYDDPGSESYEVRGDDLTIELADGRRRGLSIDQHPVLRAFVESYRATLAGDERTLERYFRVELSGSTDAWVLRLIPRNPELAGYLSGVTMRGRERTVYSVETLEASGDRSVMTLDLPVE